jgi:hypothetical protein
VRRGTSGATTARSSSRQVAETQRSSPTSAKRGRLRRTGGVSTTTRGRTARSDTRRQPGTRRGLPPPLAPRPQARTLCFLWTQPYSESGRSAIRCMSLRLAQTGGPQISRSTAPSTREHRSDGVGDRHRARKHPLNLEHGLGSIRRERTSAASLPRGPDGVAQPLRGWRQICRPDIRLVYRCTTTRHLTSTKAVLPRPARS